jgi:uncharacterized protein with von Willebrand factor type A (vWA) domain
MVGTRKREYILSTFSSNIEDMLKVNQKATLPELFEWARYNPSGGTNVNAVLCDAMDVIHEKFIKGGVDIVILTDELFRVGELIIKDFKEFKSKYGCRLMVIRIGAYGNNPDIDQIADAVLDVTDLSEANVVKLAKGVSSWIR